MLQKNADVNEEPLEWNRLFIHLGPFHIEMSYLKAVGSFINKSGLTNVLVESGLLAAGSVSGFMSAKNFNRAKRLHILVSLALEMEHFQFFLESQDIRVNNNIKHYLRSLMENGLLNNKIDNSELRELIEDYSIFREKTVDGLHGKTPQYFIKYSSFIYDYLLLERSIRTGDFALFKYILLRINDIFFPFHHVNYARWLVRYHDILLRIDKTHPGLKKEFEDGFFSIKRTNKAFSKQPVDLVIEQTINADAGRTLTGISHFTNSIRARLRLVTFMSYYS